MDEILETKKDDEVSKAFKDEENDMNMDEFINDWKREFDILNPNPEENSDFDSDNEINPLDTITNTGQYKSSKKMPISTDNKMKNRPI